MRLKGPKQIYWTRHSESKMRFYGLSAQRVRRVIHSPRRIEEGIAPDTVAYMQSAGSARHPYEIWVMIQDDAKQRRVISTWKYPGVTKPGAPLPQAILQEIEELSDIL